MEGNSDSFMEKTNLSGEEDSREQNSERLIISIPVEVEYTTQER